MQTWVVACPKGGVGKTTIVTHLDTHLAAHHGAGAGAVLVDADPQQSTQRWSARRPDTLTAVAAIDGTHRGWRRRVPRGARRVVADTLAGASVRDLDRVLDAADALTVPMQPSALDLEAASGSLQALARQSRVRSGNLPVGLVSNRCRPGTRAADVAGTLLQQWPFPLVARLRDSQAWLVPDRAGQESLQLPIQPGARAPSGRAPLLRCLQQA